MGLPLRKSIVITCLAFMLAFTVLTNVTAQTPEPERYPVFIYLFWGEGCPHCAKTKPYYESLAEKYPEIVLRTYEIYTDIESTMADEALRKAYDKGERAYD